jgi:hypothetical protein
MVAIITLFEGCENGGRKRDWGSKRKKMKVGWSGCYKKKDDPTSRNEVDAKDPPSHTKS